MSTNQRMNFMFNEEVHLHMIDHVFLPRMLPTDLPSQPERTECALLAMMCDVINGFEQQDMPDVVKDLFKKMYSLHCQNKIEPNKLSAQMKNLQPKQMMGVFLRKANCGLFLMRSKSEKSDEVTMATFLANLPNEEIYGIDDTKINGDIQVDYPTRAIDVEMSKLIKSKDFAEQISHLHEMNRNRIIEGGKGEAPFQIDIDASTAKYVSQWLIGAASNRESKVSTKFPSISKKMRDEPGQGFRRSGLWVTIKVFLQLSLTIALGATNGKYMYKLVMLRFMSTMCECFSEYSERNLNIDTAVEVIAKTARRIEKLANFPDASVYTQSMLDLTAEVKAEAIECIAMVRDILQKTHKKMLSRETKETKLNTTGQLKFDEHIFHKLSLNFDNYLKRRNNAICRIVLKEEKCEQDVKIKFEFEIFNAANVPDVQQMAKLSNDRETLRFLCDVENWVLIYLDDSQKKSDVKYLRDLATEYLAKALHFYKNDPVAYSTMVLTILKIIQILDSAACKNYAIFRSHSAGIHTKMFDNLIVTSSLHLDGLIKLQKYFVDRYDAARFPGLLEEDEITELSFSARFAEQDAEMIETKKLIHRMDANNMEKKRKEVAQQRGQIGVLRSSAATKTCNCNNNSCAKCKIQREILNYKIEIYRCSLMPDPMLQNAVVFELRIPDVIACLRDVLYLFVTKHHDETVGNWPKCISWVEHRTLKTYSTGCAKNVFLGTNSKYLNRRSTRGTDNFIHPDSADGEFIDKHTSDYNCLMCGKVASKPPKKVFTKMPTKTKSQSIKKFVTFSVEKSSVYENLQWTLESTMHTQNKVLATQSECPPDLSIAEYINFGSLRADGHRLQLRNLYRVISDESLSFETPSVLALVMQTLWEAGPATMWYRESNEDFVNVDFVQAMTDLLDAYTQRQQSNWRNPLKLVVATLVVCRMFEMNSDAGIADRLAEVLLKFRSIATTWISLIENAISERQSDKTNPIELNAILMDVAICGTLTYFVNRHHIFFEKIFESTGDHSPVFAWLKFNNLLYRHNNSQRESREVILRIAHAIGLNVEYKMAVMIENNPDEVYKFVRLIYAETRNRTLNALRHLQNKRHTVEIKAAIEGEIFIVNVDYVFGEFLVNGLSMGRLPETITKHATFQRIFGTTIFDVQPTKRAFSTAYKGFVYIFREDAVDGVIVIEQSDSSVECVKELVPHSKLIDIVPYLLVENFSHWYNRERNVIEFRPKLFNDVEFATVDGIQYELDLETRRLIHIKTQRFLLDVRSLSFVSIARLLERLEHKNYINVLMDTPHKARVELVRMKLNFIIDCSERKSCYDIQSNEYIEMRVSLRQSIDTLFGLRFGLVLESMNEPSTKLLIVPHGKFSIHPTDHHVEIKMFAVDAGLRDPSFFIYHVNSALQTLKANSFAAWFYLAYLHAVTSYPLPDPFTGMTGVERALQILQSAFAWSSAPYDKESINTLTALADLSPCRRIQAKQRGLQGHSYQLTQWPQHVRHHAAQDAFVLIVHKLHADSMRLSQLFPPNDKRTALKLSTCITLNARSHARYVPYAPNCSISESFMKCDYRMSHFIAEEIDDNLKNVRELAAHYNSTDPGFHVPTADIGSLLFDLFSSEKALTGRTNANDKENNPVSSIMHFCLSSSFANLWIRLYECIRLRQMTNEQLHLAFTLLAAEGNDIRHLLILQSIAANQMEFIQCETPSNTSYRDVNCYEFDRVALEKAIDATKIPVEAYIESHRTPYDEPLFSTTQIRCLKNRYSDNIYQLTTEWVEEAKRQWPCAHINLSRSEFKSTFFDVGRVCIAVNALLQTWYNNKMLKQFTRRVDKIFSANLRRRSSPSFTNQPKWPVYEVDTESFPKYAIDFEGKMCSSYSQYEPDIESARQIFEENASNDERTLEQWWQRFRKISISESYLVNAELYPRLVPTTILPQILRPTNDKQYCLIGALAVMTCREQRAMRDAHLLQKSEMEAAIRPKQENTLHENWKPHEHPEWLLFEIEMDLSIRRVQVEIAKRMIHPPDDKHTVMQLNMGEGKTSVIVPIVAAELANGEQLCTVTVLRHLFQTNLRSLRQSVGGMLQRRVYTMPCRRDMDIDSVVVRIQAIYEECKRERGIVITLPEYRLSFELKIYDSARKDHIAAAKRLLSVHDWLNQNSRHIMDESDAILQPNYRLIYAVGENLAPDGGALRWTCIQAVLKRVPHHMKRLFIQFGDRKIEFNENYACDGVDYGSGDVRNRPEVFRPCRVLDATVYDKHLKIALADDFLSGELQIQFPETTQSVRDLIRDVLVDETLSDGRLKQFLNQFEETHQQTILILSGLLKFGILRLALTKRWRVNYGRNMKGARKMAVPFKAKDVAAEMTEFGHPDVAICLTHLAYYYSGLSDTELRETFQSLDLTENPHESYSEWMRLVPAHLKHESIESYSGVNLSDAKQRTVHLFPLLRRNMYVIDYWLSHVVFPREAKIFTKRLMCSAWDLCTEHLTHKVTGFSGTNDTKLMLPMPIVQNDLPELEATNENVRNILLREENDHYQHLSSNISGMEILRRLVNEDIPVLLDAGALMLELNNEQVAREWLKLMPSESYDAAIYFSGDDIMLAIDRNNFVTEFEYSVYREQLSRCVVYLDDVHTRGTDLKFPHGIRACVTLSGGITRDKTVQACMRMRMLGRGHQISFWASHEADIGIRKLCHKSGTSRIATANVIKYLCYNSAKFVEDGMSYWMSAAQNYAQKLAAHKFLETSQQLATKPSSDALLQQLGERCSDPEFMKLIDLYGARKTVKLTIVADTAFGKVKNLYTNDSIIHNWITDEVEKPVHDKLTANADGVVRYTQYLDEEYEKELEYELEEVREVSRPQTQKPLQPQYNSNLKDFIGQSNGRWKAFNKMIAEKTIETLPRALQHAQIFSLVRSELNAWDPNLWVTKDFRSVVQLNADVKDDEYLRPVWWIVRVDADEEQKSDTFILISPFECNELMSLFRSTCNSTLHMFSAKLSQSQSTLINNQTLQLPSNSAAYTIGLNTIVQLSMFAGSMYFDNAAEESAYCNFIGVIPRPRTEEQQKAFEAGYITNSGYVSLQHRQHFPDLLCRFKENPDKITIGIIERRHGYSRKRSHVAQIFGEAKRFKWDNDD